MISAEEILQVFECRDSIKGLFVPNILFQMRSVRLPVSPASLPKIPHDQAQGRGRLGVCVPDLRETF